ncbi:MAG: helix-turn-helix transcriptional regulator [Micrococcales bacterium]|nr:helix-turn-helix transcriptional regulator [Micrococcales bacterium]
MTQTPDIWWELRVIREKDGHSLTSLAKAADMSLGYLSDLENGRRWPNAVVTKKLAVALNVPVSVLEKPRMVEVPA